MKQRKEGLTARDEISAQQRLLTMVAGVIRDEQVSWQQYVLCGCLKFNFFPSKVRIKAEWPSNVLARRLERTMGGKYNVAIHKHQAHPRCRSQAEFLRFSRNLQDSKEPYP